MSRFLTRCRRASIAATVLGAAAVTWVLSAGGCGRAERPPVPEISLIEAVVNGDDAAVRAHVAAGTAVDTQNFAGDTALGVAAALGRVEAARELIGAGADLEIRNKAGVTPLFNAAFFGHREIVRALVDAGADRGTTDRYGIPVLHLMEMPWEEIEPVYEAVHGAIGMSFDADRIRSVRPTIASMLR